MTTELRSALDEFVASNPVAVFMKGSKDAPQCGFSSTAVQILNALGVEFEAVDVLASDRLREGVKEYSSWPTFPQIFVDGELFGGCDILVEAYTSGDLPDRLKPTDPDADEE